MTVASRALFVRCLHCGSTPGTVCLTPNWPGKDTKSRRPLKFSPCHPIRAALAACIEAGATEAAAVRAARWAATSREPKTEVPWLDVARTAVMDAEREAVGLYRSYHPAEPLAVPDQPTLELGL